MHFLSNLLKTLDMIIIIKKTIVFVLLLTFFCGCDPGIYIFVRNLNEKQVSVKVKHDKRMLSSLFDSIPYKPCLVNTLNKNSLQYMNEKLNVNWLDSNSYIFNLKGKSICILNPIVLNPTKEVEISEDGKINTIIFYGKNSNLHENKKKYSIQKRGFYNKTIIIDIKESP